MLCSLVGWLRACIAYHALQQASDMALYCIPAIDPCDYTIGVYAWTAASYTIQVGVSLYISLYIR
jgi:hypothetical protein